MATLVLDNFTDVDGTSLSTHTPDVSPIDWNTAENVIIQTNTAIIQNPQVVYVLDYFNGTNGTNINTHPMILGPGSGWNIHGFSVLEIDNTNSLINTASYYEEPTYCACGVSAYNLDVTLSINRGTFSAGAGQIIGGEIGVIFRQQGSDYCRVTVAQLWTFSLAGGNNVSYELRVISTTSGVDSLIGSASIPPDFFTSDVNQQIILSQRGTKIIATVGVDGSGSTVEVVSGLHLNGDSGGCGVYIQPYGRHGDFTLSSYGSPKALDISIVSYGYDNYAVIDVQTSDVEISSTISSLNSYNPSALVDGYSFNNMNIPPAVGLYFRFVDESNFWSARVECVEGSSSEKMFSLVQRLDGIDTLINSFVFSNPSFANQILSASCEGLVISVKLNSLTINTTSSVLQTATQHGFFIGNSNQSEDSGFDVIEVDGTPPSSSSSLSSVSSISSQSSVSLPSLLSDSSPSSPSSSSRSIRSTSSSSSAQIVEAPLAVIVEYDSYCTWSFDDGTNIWRIFGDGIGNWKMSITEKTSGLLIWYGVKC